MRPHFTPSILIGRALRLKCPRCGAGKLFAGWFQMQSDCEHCQLLYEKAPGYFLGSAYINYAITAIMITVLYLALHFRIGYSNKELAGPLALFCILFPLFSFRYARALWLAMDTYFDRSESEKQSEP